MRLLCEALTKASLACTRRATYVCVGTWRNDNYRCAQHALEFKKRDRRRLPQSDRPAVKEIIE